MGRKRKTDGNGSAPNDVTIPAEADAGTTTFPGVTESSRKAVPAYAQCFMIRVDLPDTHDEYPGESCWWSEDNTAGKLYPDINRATLVRGVVPAERSARYAAACNRGSVAFLVPCRVEPQGEARRVTDSPDQHTAGVGEKKSPSAPDSSNGRPPTLPIPFSEPTDDPSVTVHAQSAEAWPDGIPPEPAWKDVRDI